MAVSFITPTGISLAGISASTWTAVSSATSGVPAGASGAILRAVTTNTTTVSARMTGSTDSFTSGVLGAGRQLLMFTGVNGSQSFDFWLSSSTGLTLYLIGYFGSETTFFTNAAPLANLGISFASYNVSANCPNGVAALLSVDSCFACYFRQNGSSDNHANNNASVSRQYFMVGLDGSQIFQGKAGNTSQTPKLLGYMTGGIVWNLNAPDRTPGTAGSFQPLATEPNAVGYLYDLDSPSVSTLYCLRTQGSGYITSAAPPDSLSGQDACGNPAEININSTVLSVYELGYFLSGTSGTRLLGTVLM